MSKARLTVTVDPHLIGAGTAAVAEGRADSLSSWVNLALADRAARDRRLRALADAVAAYERKFGSITADELAVQERADRAAARVVRGARPARARVHRVRRRGVA
jgi:hypothetical protein